MPASSWRGHFGTNHKRELENEKAYSMVALQMPPQAQNASMAVCDSIAALVRTMVLDWTSGNVVKFYTR